MFIFITLLAVALEATALPRTHEQVVAHNRLIETFGCAHLMDPLPLPAAVPVPPGEFHVAGLDHERRIPKIWVRGAAYEADFPVAELYALVERYDGRFMIGWDEAPTSPFSEEMRLERIDPDDESIEAARARALWHTSTNEKWILSQMFEHVPELSRTEALRDRWRGVQVAEFETFLRDGRVFPSEYLTDLKRDSVKVEPSDVLGHLSQYGYYRADLHELQLSYTQANGNPPSFADIIRLSRPFVWGFKDKLAGRGWQGRFELRVVTEVQGQLYVYTISPVHTQMSDGPTAP